MEDHSRYVLYPRVGIERARGKSEICKQVRQCKKIDSWSEPGAGGDILQVGAKVVEIGRG